MIPVNELLRKILQLNIKTLRTVNIYNIKQQGSKYQSPNEYSHRLYVDKVCDFRCQHSFKTKILQVPACYMTNSSLEQKLKNNLTERMTTCNQSSSPLIEN
jgi:hypothetical protein